MPPWIVKRTEREHLSETWDFNPLNSPRPTDSECSRQNCQDAMIQVTPCLPSLRFSQLTWNRKVSFWVGGSRWKPPGNTLAPIPRHM